MIGSSSFFSGKGRRPATPPTGAPFPPPPASRTPSRDDRYAPYREIVRAAPRVAYITASQPWLDTYLRQALRSRLVGYEETVIGDYRVFHSLTEAVRPVDLGLGPGAEPGAIAPFAR